MKNAKSARDKAVEMRMRFRKNPGANADGDGAIQIAVSRTVGSEQIYDRVRLIARGEENQITA